MEITTQQAVEKIVSELKTDEGYYIGWKANIAMAFQDEFWRNINSHEDLDLMDHETLHKIANAAADNFLNLLCSK